MILQREWNVLQRTEAKDVHIPNSVAKKAFILVCSHSLFFFLAQSETTGGIIWFRGRDSTAQEPSK